MSSIASAQGLAPIPGPGLPARGDAELLEHYARSRRADLREELTRRFSGLAQRLARRYTGKGEALEDLEQVAHVGLAKALEGFDPDMQRPFQTYAVPTILGELRRHFRDHCWSIHVPRGVKDLGMRVAAAGRELAGDLGRQPTLAEIASHLDAEVEDVVEVVIAQQAARPARLDAPIDADGAESAPLWEIVGREDPGFEHAEDRIVIAERLARLTAREREVLRLRFGHELSQTEIGDRVGVSQMQVSRILRAALDRLQPE